MGGKKKEKENVKEKPNGQKAGNATSSFKLPEPDRTVNVTVPPLLPPAEDEEDLELSVSGEMLNGLPRKVVLSHLPLLTHPVTISALDNFMSEEECRTWIVWGEQTGFEEAKQKASAEFAHRDNGRILLQSPDVAHLLWLRIRPFVPEALKAPGGSRRALGCSPRIRLYRYTRGQRFGQHIDTSTDEPSMGGVTHFTVLVYLNGGPHDSEERQLRGGETIFWKDHDGKRPALAFPPLRGACLFHGHGDECMTHEGAAVEAGTKYVLRTDVVYELEQ
eukprot:gnl/TRDRNA2_/TRDRNA2_198743_c0_seq1.p1 gnl/TRDRNA2_/TRDRNA2_198743_c0~~gnl/TRDRNA2_/TRDRNA2_198743_c0_seq1.p1  ORF type:complete len:276 (-),score=49.61 gnl/TRDRNA2_/TRDRNA2_198743_c0_seq1:116-943(-)